MSLVQRTSRQKNIIQDRNRRVTSVYSVWLWDQCDSRSKAKRNYKRWGFSSKSFHQNSNSLRPISSLLYPTHPSPFCYTDSHGCAYTLQLKHPQSLFLSHISLTQPLSLPHIDHFLLEAYYQGNTQIKSSASSSPYPKKKHEILDA